MRKFNTFWNGKEHIDEPRPVGESLTIQGLNMDIRNLIKEGKINELTLKQKERMIFGDRIKIEDLTKIDYFRTKIKRYENLVKNQVAPPIDTPTNPPEEPKA